jgi:hypothetical protein
MTSLSVLRPCPREYTRTRAASLAGTSSTVSLSAANRCASGRPAPEMRAGPQGCARGLAQGRRGPCAVWRSFDVGPLERAEPGQDALPDASFQAVDQYLVAKLPGQAQIPR